MKQINTKAIILRRTDFGEADRILTMISQDHGKIRIIAKGVRRMKSKLAGGLELLSLSDITYIHGRSDIYTLVSARLDKHYANIVKDLNRTMLAYDLMKKIDKLTEDSAGEEYFELLCRSLNALDYVGLNTELLELWFNLRLLRITGHAPNLMNDTTGTKLMIEEKYALDPEEMTFARHSSGQYGADHIKLLRVSIGVSDPLKLVNIQDAEKYTSNLLKLSRNLVKLYLGV